MRSAKFCKSARGRSIPRNSSVWSITRSKAGRMTTTLTAVTLRVGGGGSGGEGPWTRDRRNKIKRKENKETPNFQNFKCKIFYEGNNKNKIRKRGGLMKP